MEQIFLKLKKAELVKSVKGPGGGYQLVNSPEQITIENIIFRRKELSYYFAIFYFLKIVS